MSKASEKREQALRIKLGVERDTAVMEARAQMLVPARTIREIVRAELEDGDNCPVCGEDWPRDGGAHTADCRWEELNAAVADLCQHDRLPR